MGNLRSSKLDEEENGVCRMSKKSQGQQPGCLEVGGHLVVSDCVMMASQTCRWYVVMGKGYAYSIGQTWRFSYRYYLPKRVAEESFSWTAPSRGFNPTPRDSTELPKSVSRVFTSSNEKQEIKKYIENYYQIDSAIVENSMNNLQTNYIFLHEQIAFKYSFKYEQHRYKFQIKCFYLQFILMNIFNSFLRIWKEGWVIFIALFYEGASLVKNF